jgi:DNA-binding XRE family transcriptional regulator
VLVFRLPGKIFKKTLDFLIARYPYVYFKDKKTELGRGVFLRPEWINEEIPNTPKEKVRYFRTEQNLTQQALAELAETTQANIASIESGKRPIGKNMAKRIGEALAVDYRVFL